MPNVLRTCVGTLKCSRPVTIATPAHTETPAMAYEKSFEGLIACIVTRY